MQLVHVGVQTAVELSQTLVETTYYSFLAGVFFFLNHWFCVSLSLSLTMQVSKIQPQPRRV